MRQSAFETIAIFRQASATVHRVKQWNEGRAVAKAAERASFRFWDENGPVQMEEVAMKVLWISYPISTQVVCKELHVSIRTSLLAQHFCVRVLALKLQ